MENTHILPGDTNQIIPLKQTEIAGFQILSSVAQPKTHHFRIINFLPQYLPECPRRGKIWRQNCFLKMGKQTIFCDGLFNGVFTDWGHFHLIWLLSRDGWHWLWGDILNDDWAQAHFKIKQLPVTSRQQPSEPNIREIPDWFPTQELSWARGFHDCSNLRTLHIICLLN